MTLTAKDVAEITRLLEESSFDELYLELDGLKLSLKRGAAVNDSAVGTASSAATSNVAPAPTSAPVPNSASMPSAATGLRSAPNGPASASAPAPVAADSNVHNVVAPLLGTFYRAPKPGAPPFVEVGSRVEEDTIIGIIEVMKLMNTVRAGVRGTVSEIAGRDGVLVEYGETLVRVSKTS